MYTILSQYVCGCQVREFKRGEKGYRIKDVIIEYCPKHKAAEDMYGTGQDLLMVMCELCRRLNPQHAECQSCEEIEGYRKAYAKAVKQ